MTVPELMRASVLTEPGSIEMIGRPTPQVANDEVLVDVSAVGICGSDIHYYEHGCIGQFVVDAPIVLGHEAAGAIAALGAAVDPSRIGERVSIKPQRPCRRCEHCKSGLYNLCPEMEFFATPPIDGALCEYVAVPHDFAHPVPTNMSDEAAALIEPLSVGIWACERGGVDLGSAVLIAGAGPIGLVSAQVAAVRGAARTRCVPISKRIVVRRHCGLVRQM